MRHDKYHAISCGHYPPGFVGMKQVDFDDLCSDLAAAEKQGDAAHEACVAYEERVSALERENKALHLLVDSEWGEHTPERRKAWLERILHEHEHPEEEM